MADFTAKETFSKVYQFKIVLKESKPQIWRRIQVPENYTFRQLSEAILKSMGWKGTHLHEFKMKNPETYCNEIIGIHFTDENQSRTTRSETELYIRDFFINEKDKAIYTYDFGDDWKHDVKLEKILPIDPKVSYPICISGKRACSVEDCGGIWEYTSILEMLEKKSNLSTEEKSTLQWVKKMKGENFNSNVFDPKSCFFDP